MIGDVRWENVLEDYREITVNLGFIETILFAILRGLKFVSNEVQHIEIIFLIHL